MKCPSFAARVSTPVRMLVPAVFAVLGCGGGAGSESELTSADGPGIAGLKICQALMQTLDELERCTPPSDVMIETNRLKREQLMDTTSIDAAAARRQAQDCALMLGNLIDRGGVVVGGECNIGLTRWERAVIAAERRRRTQPPEYLAASDLRLLQERARFRDRMCSCADNACIKEVDTTSRALDEAGSGSLSGDRTAEQTFIQIVDETIRCEINVSGGYPAMQGAPGGATLARRPGVLPRADAAVLKPRPIVEQVRFPDGAVLYRRDCAKIYAGIYEGVEGATACRAYFEKLTGCREQHPNEPERAEGCEGAATAAWVDIAPRYEIRENYYE